MIRSLDLTNILVRKCSTPLINQLQSIYWSKVNILHAPIWVKLLPCLLVQHLMVQNRTVPKSGVQSLPGTSTQNCTEEICKKEEETGISFSLWERKLEIGVTELCCNATPSLAIPSARLNYYAFWWSSQIRYESSVLPPNQKVITGSRENASGRNNSQ